MTPSLFAKLPFNAGTDYQPIVLGSTIPSLLVVTPSQSIRSVKYLIAHARARPGALSYGGIGIGGGTHLAMALFEGATGTQMLYVVYKGSQQAGKHHLVHLPGFRRAEKRSVFRRALGHCHRIGGRRCAFPPYDLT